MNNSAELEAPQNSPRSYFSNEAQGSRCFPCEAFKFCPIGVKAFIPRTWQKIQDEVHLILVLGVMAGAALVVHEVIALFYTQACWETLCIAELLALVCIMPCCFYCFRIISQYDDRLASKQKDCKEQKANLTRTYNDLLSDMDGLLVKSAESSSGLAERSFESKRRDFQRFLERAKNKYSSTYSGAQGDSDKLLMQFRRFCVNWLTVFEECSIDPVQCPKRVVSAEELNRCTSIVDVADLCLERLRVTEVRFISIQRDQDAQMLRKNRNELKRMTLTLPSSGRPAPAPAPKEVPPAPRYVSWIRVGTRQGWGITGNPDSDDRYPKECNLGCLRLVVLSFEHFTLLLGFVVGWVILFLKLFILLKYTQKEAYGPEILGIGEMVVIQVSICTMLAKFEELDTIQQLEREVRELAKQNEHVEKQREKMREFWTNAQQLTELWLYRTVPRLDLYKELHSLLEDTEEDLLMKISSANQALEELESSLGALQAWRCDGALTLDEKKNFGKSINQLCQEQEFDGILVKLEEVTTNGMKTLQAK